MHVRKMITMAVSMFESNCEAVGEGEEEEDAAMAAYCTRKANDMW